MVNEANEEDPIWQKYRNELLSRYWTKIKNKLGDRRKSHHEIVKYLNLLDESFKEAEKEAGIEPFWHKTPEEILGLREALPAPYSSYREWLVEFLSSTLRSMDPRELAELIVSCCGGECIYKGLTRHRKG